MSTNAAMALVRPAQTVAGFEITTISNGTFKENCYVVTHGASPSCLVVDPGSEHDFLAEHIASRGLQPSKIVLTHGHFDHLGAVDALMTRFTIGCEVHALEERLVRQAATYAFRFSREPLRVPRGLTFFSGESPLAWDGGAIDVLPTPGHTSGSVALAVGDAFVFTGDTLFHERIGPTTYPESDPQAIGPSIAALLDRLPADCVIFPGHGRPWTVGAARTWWYALKGPAPSQTIF